MGRIYPISKRIVEDHPDDANGAQYGILLRAGGTIRKAAVVTLAASLAGACSTEGTRGVALLAPPPQDQIKFVGIPTTNPFAQERDGVLSRATFAARVADRAVEVQDFLVGPAQKTAVVGVAGAAIFEVREGSGTVTIQGKTTALSNGATFVASEGEKLILEPRGVPLIVRAYIFRSEE